MIIIMEFYSVFKLSNTTKNHYFGHIVVKKIILSLLISVTFIMPKIGHSQIFNNAIKDSIKTKIMNFIDQDTIKKGLLFGIHNGTNNKTKIITKGAINKHNDLKLACPIIKPCLSYIILKENINVNTTIDKWFPVEKGYKKADTITIEMLLLNRSGIKDFAKLIPMHPDSIVKPIETIKVAYKNNNLNFNPGEKFQYSNTNFNILGIILEKETGKSFNKLIKEYFGDIAPSLRMDNGKANYPNGYIEPWPFHWSTTGFSGGLVGNAEDAMHVFSYITEQPEFGLMADWHRRSHNENMLYGYGIFAKEDYHGLGKAIYYDGNMVACQMFIIKIDQQTYYFHTAHKANPSKLYDFVREIVFMVHTD